MVIFLSIIIILLFGLYCFSAHNLEYEKISNKEYKNQIDSMQNRINSLLETDAKLRAEQKETIKTVLKNEIKRIQRSGLYQKYTPDSLCDLILEHSYYTNVYEIKDIDFENFEKTIKTAIYADKGYLDYYQDTSNGSDDFCELFRIDSSGKHITLTPEEVEKIANNDYDFIFDSIPLK